MKIPTRRNLEFKTNKSTVLNWNKNGKSISTFLNTMSLFFPVGERFFIDSVRNYRHLAGGDLEKAIKAFIGQEAMHGREHDAFNESLAEAGVSVKFLEDRVVDLLEIARKFPKKTQLEITVALEHFTAILAKEVLDDPSIVDGYDKELQEMWKWHALEEDEHKAVAYDLYELTGNVFLTRSITMISATLIFLGMLTLYYVIVSYQSKTLTLKETLRLVNFLFGKPGVFRKIVIPYLKFYKKDFHPERI